MSVVSFSASIFNIGNFSKSPIVITKVGLRDSKICFATLEFSIPSITKRCLSENNDEPRPSKMAPAGENLKEDGPAVTSAQVILSLKKKLSFSILAPVFDPFL